MYFHGKFVIIGTMENSETDVAQRSKSKAPTTDRLDEERDVLLVGVRLRPGWPIIHFCSEGLDVADGEWVMVPTDHGPEVGQVVGCPVNVSLPLSACPLAIKRLASTREIDAYYKNLEREHEARRICSERIRALGLSMKLVRVESFYDGSKIVFYYSADGRVDFRELVKDMVKALRVRVEMRQIGIRHEAKMIGGVGSCGRELCCSSFLKSFDPISIKMAKAQNLPLNPNKISGFCGRLLCCLTYEYSTYQEFAKDMPNLGKSCETPAGHGKVVRHNVLKQTITVALPGGDQLEFNKAELDSYASRGSEQGEGGKGKADGQPRESKKKNGGRRRGRCLQQKQGKNRKQCGKKRSKHRSRKKTKGKEGKGTKGIS